jgi:hypothetical protein
LLHSDSSPRSKATLPSSRFCFVLICNRAELLDALALLFQSLALDTHFAKLSWPTFRTPCQLRLPHLNNSLKAPPSSKMPQHQLRSPVVQAAISLSVSGKAAASACLLLSSFM